MALAGGTRVGPYEIIALTAAGGMGEVYRACDTRLGRTVAIKILHSHLSSDPKLKLRFEREAQTISKLTHPHICALYDVGHYDGRDYLVLEFVEGQTLEKRLKQGSLPLRDLLRCAIQVAEALDKAHKQGVVHRDLKPGNIMLTKSGSKVLDFGLAKLVAEPTPVVSLPELKTDVGKLTSHGTVVGTLQYLAPEQFEGAEPDARTDIFALGTIIYEMATGRQAFLGKTKATVIGAILGSDPPPIASLQPASPPALDRLVRQCLAKDPDQRWQTAYDVLLLLRWMAEVNGELASVRPETRAIKRAKWSMVAGVTLASVVIVGSLTWLGLRWAGYPSGSPPLVSEVERLTHEPNFSEWPTWSPDGSLLAFASNRSGNFQVYVRRLEGGQEVNVTRDAAEDFQPAFSPDGNWIAFASTRASASGMIRIGSSSGIGFRTYGGDVWVIPSLGGQARRVARDGNFPAWHPGGQRLAYVSGTENHRSILEVSLEGAAVRPILPTKDSNWEITRVEYSRNEKWISFETLDQRLFLMPSGGGPPRELLRGAYHAWHPSGKHLYYLTQNLLGGTRLEGVSVDDETGQVKYKPNTLGLMTGILRDLAVGPNGQQIVVSEVEESLNLYRLPLTPGGGAPAGAEERLTSGQVRDSYPVVSPDGKRIAVSSNRLGRSEIWLLDPDSKNQQNVKIPGPCPSVDRPFWSPDGKQLAVTCLRTDTDGMSSLWLVALDGSVAEEIVTFRPGLSGGPFSPDGKHLLFTYRKIDNLQLFVLDRATRGERQLTTSSSDKYDSAWSRDGRWVVFASNAAGAVQVWRIAATGGEEKVLTPGSERMRHLFYSPDGLWIYVQPSHRNIYRLPAAGGPIERVTNFAEPGLFIEEPTISPDGRYLVYSRSSGGASLWLLRLNNHQASQRSW